jgi:tetratricopeptide (TPR) repeat protein
MRLINILVFLLVTAFFLTSCKTEHAGIKANSNQEVNTLILTNTFLDAKRKLYRGDVEAANNTFFKCIKMQENHDASYFELARINEFQNPELAIKYINKAIEYAPNNNWYKEFLVRVYKQQKDFSSAVDVINELIKQNPYRKEYYYEWANLCINNKDYNQAIVAYNKLLENFSYEEGVLKQQKQIYLKKGDYKKAIEVIEELIEHNPENKNYYGMIAEIYLNSNKPEKAIEYYNKILEIDPDDGFVHFSIADYYHSKGNREKTYEELKKGMSSENLDIDSKVKVLVKMMQLAEIDSTYRNSYEELLDIALEVNYDSPKIVALKADYCNNKNDNRCAITYLRKVIELDSSKYIIWEQLLINEEEIGDFNSILKESNRALRIFPQQPKLYYYSALGYAYNNNWKKAKERVHMGSNFVYSPIDKASFLALEAKASFRLNENANAMANYQRAISLDPNNALILKNYAFDLASFTKENLKSISYAKQALKIESGNAEYIYVYAYCLFKDGQKEEALKWLRPALNKFPENKNLQLLDMEINKNE